MFLSRFVANIVIGLIMGVFANASAGAVLIGAYDAGHYNKQGSDSASHTPAPVNQVYITGINGFGNIRSYFVFDLSGVSAAVVSATLHFNPGYYLSSDPSEHFSLYDVSTPVDELMAGISLSQVGFDRWSDLGSGTVLGGGDVLKHVGAVNADVSFGLNADGVEYINRHLLNDNSLVAFGGTVTTLSTSTGFNSKEAVFGSLFGWPYFDSIKLTLEFREVPEPHSLLLMFIAVGLLFCTDKICRRRLFEARH